MTAAFADGFSLYFRQSTTVEIAVGIYRNGLVAADVEGNMRRVAGFERLALTAVLRFHINPFDKVLGKHRMVCAAYVDGYNAVCNGNDRKMLFPAFINRIAKIEAPFSDRSRKRERLRHGILRRDCRSGGRCKILRSYTGTSCKKYCCKSNGSGSGKNGSRTVSIQIIKEAGQKRNQNVRLFMRKRSCEAAAVDRERVTGYSGKERRKKVEKRRSGRRKKRW